MVLTQDEFYINNEVKEQIDSDRELWNSHAELLPYSENIPNLHIAKILVEQQENLSYFLGITEQRNSFTINCYYFLNSQIQNHSDIDVSESSAMELAIADLTAILTTYNKHQTIVH